MKVAVISGVRGQDGALLANLLLTKQYQVIGLLLANKTSDLYRLDYLKIRDTIP